MRHVESRKANERCIQAAPHWEQPHDGTRTEAPNGHGTIRGWPPGKTLDRPVLDGATQSKSFEHDVDNPWRGLADPGLITHPEWGTKSRIPRFFWWRKRKPGY